MQSIAAPKKESSKEVLLRADSRGLATSKRRGNLTGLQVTLLSFGFSMEASRLLGSGTLRGGALRGRYSNHLSSTKLQILSPKRDAESSEAGLTPATAYYYSCDSVTVLRRSPARLTQAQTSATTCERGVVSTWLQNPYKALVTGSNVVRNCRRLSQHCNIGIIKENTLSGAPAPHEILHAEQGTAQVIIGIYHAVQTHDKTSDQK